MLAVIVVSQAGGLEPTRSVCELVPFYLKNCVNFVKMPNYPRSELVIRKMRSSLPIPYDCCED